MNRILKFFWDWYRGAGAPYTWSAKRREELYRSYWHEKALRDIARCPKGTCAGCGKDLYAETEVCSNGCAEVVEMQLSGYENEF